jgi:hypothetical protein
MDGTTRFEIVGIFHDRGDLERAMDALEGSGIQRPQMSLLGTKEAVEAKLGLPLREVQEKPQAAADPGTPRQEPIKRDEAGTLTGMMASIPAYAGAVLAAGVTAASGGALAGVAVAALAGAAAGGAAGGSAGRLFDDSVDRAYDEQLRAGGICLIVALKDPGQANTVKRVLEEHAAKRVETQVVTG